MNEFNEHFTLKWTFCHYLLILMLFQTRTTFFLLLNANQASLKNVLVTMQLQ